MIRAIYLFTNLQELPSDGDSLLVFARPVKVNNLFIEGISLGSILRLTCQAECNRQDAKQNKQELQRVPVHAVTANANPCTMPGHQYIGTRRPVKIQHCWFSFSGIVIPF